MWKKLMSRSLHFTKSIEHNFSHRLCCAQLLEWKTSKDERATAPFSIGIGIPVATRTLQILEEERYLKALFRSGNVCSGVLKYQRHIVVI